MSSFKKAVLFVPTVIFALLWLWGCEMRYEFQGKQGDYQVKAFYKATYSSKLEGFQELSGTVVEAEFTESKTTKGDSVVWEQTPHRFSARGWNKHLRVLDWNKSVPLRVSMAGVEEEGVDVSPRFSGFSSLFDTLKSLPLHPSLQNRLKHGLDTTYFRNYWKARWDLQHFPAKGVYTKRQHLTDSLDLGLQGFEVDSVVVTGERRRNDRECFEYSVYYTRQDSIRLDMEELLTLFEVHFNRIQMNFWTASPDGGPRILQPGKWESETLEGQWFFSMDKNNGTPCYEFQKEEIFLEIKQESAIKSLRANLYRFREYVYRNSE